MAETTELKNIVEAALLAAGRPLSIEAIQALFPEIECPDRNQLRAALEELSSDYAGRGIEVAEVASGWRIQVRENCSPWVSRLWEERPARYSRALLETLALIAYRQPITRGEIEDIRGVSVSTNIIKTLMEREWVRVVGHRDVPGRPSLYGTTRDFLDYFGLKSLDELPTLAELRDLDEINRELDLGDPEAAGESQQVGDEVPAGDASEAQEGAADTHGAAEALEASEAPGKEAAAAVETDLAAESQDPETSRPVDDEDAAGPADPAAVAADAGEGADIESDWTDRVAADVVPEPR